MAQSLYRVWRPKQFSQLVGQYAIVKTLKNQVANQRTAHAYLFCGSRGTGKTSAARILASAINCQNPQNGDPCLQCPACLSLQSEACLDVFEMDAASNSRVEEIREMLEKTIYPPHGVRYKVYIIDEVHMLSNAAFNALLKTLEEPPEYMVFILATTEPQKIPATILSRCQRFDFGRISESDIIMRLKEALTDGRSAEENALQLIASNAEGSMRDAWSLMDMCLGIDEHLTELRVREALGSASRDFLFDFSDALIQRDSAQALKLCEQLIEDGKDAAVFLRDLGAHLRQMISVKLTDKPLSAVDAQQRARFSAQCAHADSDQLVSLLEGCMNAENNTRWASSASTVLDLYALKACQIPHQERVLPTEAPKPRPIAATPSAVRSPATSLAAAPTALPDNQSAPQPAPPKASEPVPVLEELPTSEAAPANSPQIEAAPTMNPGDSIATNPKLSPKEAWNRMLKLLKEQEPSLSSMVNSGKYGGYASGVFTLVFPESQRFFAEMLKDEKRNRTVKALLCACFGEEVSLSISQEDLSARSLNQQQKALQDINDLADCFGRNKIINQSPET